MARLIIKEGQDEGMSFEIRGSHFTLGRDLVNDVQLLYPKVSRQHAEIRFENNEYVLYDKESRNGTFVNGDQVDSRSLNHKDTIQLGDTVFMFIREQSDISRSESRIFDEDTTGRETVINEVPSWNVDLLKKHLISNSQLELQDSKRYLVDLYEFSRKLPEFSDETSLLAYAGRMIREIVKADRAFPVLKDSNAPEGWKFIGIDDATQAHSLSSTPISSTIFKRAVEEKISLITHRDIEDEPSESMIDYDIHSALCVPVAEDGDKGEVIGVLYADRLGGGDNFEKIELEFTTACAIILADGLKELNKLTDLKRHEEILKKEIRSRYDIVGESRTIKDTLEFIERAGSSDSVVLVMGESGTGKELIARAIHYVSPRNGEVFKTCNCAALSETLLESELFGHVKGAFTGAESDKPGVFELADNGTLFLDEIGEMSQTGQAKLLRVLEYNEVGRVGGTDVINVNVRVVAATNKDLEKEVEEGRFRQDLFHRLNVLTVTVAPLREREGDIRILLDYYIEYFSSQCGRNLGFSEEAVEKLSAYSWPGNVRELKNFVERSFILSSKDTIGTEDLPAKIMAPGGGGAGDLTLETVTRNHILKVLEMADGNKKKAAELLGIDRSTLYSKLKSAGEGDE
jgi:transcriptional regulator with GAF, ATPase, and Fis domain